MFNISDFDHKTHLSIMNKEQHSKHDNFTKAIAQRETSTSSLKTPIKRTTKLNSKYARPGRPKQAATLELLCGSGLYAFCVFLPHLPRYIYKTYMWASCWMNVIRERLLWSIFILWRITLIILEKYGYGYYVENKLLSPEEYHVTNRGQRSSVLARSRNRIRKFIFSTSTASLWEEFNQQQEKQPITGHTWGFGKTQSAFPAILMVLQDIQFLIMLAVTLAIIRIYFVHMLVPEYRDPKRLEVLTRVKSSHLLSSSSYRFGGVRGWENARRRLGERREGYTDQFSDSNNLREDETDNKSRGWYGRLVTWASNRWYRLSPSIRRALGHEPSARYNDTPTSTSFRRSNSHSSQHSFSAPRYATATFRLLYTSISCLSALILFQSAEFWPRVVLGRHEMASTRHCWSLGGSFSVLGFLDADYDNKKGQLKYFFLAQAAYQLHSLCFHVVSMLLLLRIQIQHRNQQKTQPIISMKTSMQSYLRPMIEHGIVLLLLVGAYLFSGLRRLGAVMIFTLEVSSVFLQLLQVCIYAPGSSVLRKPEVVGFVHRCLTIPSFLYCRFFVLPFFIWYSAAFESSEWLKQIEKVFSPAWSERIYAIFNGLLCFIFILNLVLFRRLLFHPHLLKIKKERIAHY